MDRLLKAINCYFVKEFDDKAILKKLPEDGIIHLAYTTYDFGVDKEHEIQVDFDLNNLRYLNYIDGILVIIEERVSLSDFIEEIENCDFDDVIRDCVNEGFKLYDE